MPGKTKVGRSYLWDEMKKIFVCNNSQKKMGKLFSEIFLALANAQDVDTF